LMFRKLIVIAITVIGIIILLTKWLIGNNMGLSTL
jgi:hypothetical protein